MHVLILLTNSQQGSLRNIMICNSGFNIVLKIPVFGTPQTKASCFPTVVRYCSNWILQQQRRQPFLKLGKECRNQKRLHLWIDFWRGLWTNIFKKYCDTPLSCFKKGYPFWYVGTVMIIYYKNQLWWFEKLLSGTVFDKHFHFKILTRKSQLQINNNMGNAL